MASSGRGGQIVAMGGGGFSMEPTNLALDRYVLALCAGPRPNVCFLGTASGDSLGYVQRFKGAFSGLGANASSLSLFRPHTADLRGFLLEQDVVYVGGGNTRSLMALWREWGLDEILREAWENGTVLAGISAGMICWFTHGVTDSIPGRLTSLPCLGLLPGSACPHYDGEPERRPTFQRMIAEAEIPAGYAADDGAALHFIGTELHTTVASRSNAHVYRVERGSSGAVETAIEPRLLGRS